jgi:hypothetical protein
MRASRFAEFSKILGDQAGLFVDDARQLADFLGQPPPAVPPRTDRLPPTPAVPAKHPQLSAAIA